MRITQSARKLLIGGALVTVVAVVAVAVHVVSGPGCADGACLAAPGGGTIESEVLVTDESGQPLAGAWVRVHGVETGGGSVDLETDSSGLVRTPTLSGPAVAVVEADGRIAEPVSLGWSDAGRRVTVRLFTKSANRFAVHSGGDVMFGRRYAVPPEGDPSGRTLPLIPDTDAARGAERVVSAVAPTFAAADLSTVNLETVVSAKPSSAAYPGKRFILSSVPDTVAGLRKLGVDVAVMANNHSRDLLDPGIADTREALRAARIGMVGAGVSADEAAAPYTTVVNGTKTAVLAYSGVDGSFVNTKFPKANTPVPTDLPEKDKWRYEARSWGFAAGPVSIPTAPRRIGDAWERYIAAEKSLGPDDVGRLWASMVAVYPEIQDWVARRGHGGAAPWDQVGSTAQIRAVSEANQLTMVQVHAGFQFQETASASMREIAHRAIDAGADIVVAHHPHVLQGVEWYKGRLIAYSMGNFVFDQNFLGTFSSAYLRTVWEGDRLLEARLMPIEIVGYRPVPVTDATAGRVLTRVWERGTLPWESYRDTSGVVRVRAMEWGRDSAPAHVTIERHTGRLTRTLPQETTRTAKVPAGQVVDLPEPSPVRPTGGSDIEVGRDLFGAGTFEDDLADGIVSDAMHWSIDSKHEGTQLGLPAQGLRFLRLEARDGESGGTRTISRIALTRHRVQTPADPPPSYSITAQVRRSSTAVPELRLEVYHFNDQNPTEDPTSDIVNTITKPLTVPADGQWHQVRVDLTVADLDAGAQPGNMVMPYLKVGSTGQGQVTFADVDDFRFVEWRRASGVTDAFSAYTMARNPSTVDQDLPYATRS